LFHLQFECFIHKAVKIHNEMFN